MIESPGVGDWMLIAVLGGFFVDWLAVGFHWAKIKPFSKISAIFLLILWTIIAGGGQVYGMLGLLVLAQGFGLAGDVFLLFSDRWFLWGLGAFLAANLLYLSLLIVRFIEVVNLRGGPGAFLWRFFLSLVLWAFLLAVFYRLIFFPLQARALRHVIGVAVQFYAWVLSTMVVLSFLMAMNMSQTSIFTWALPIGSAFFVCSDGILAYNRFVKKVPRGQLWVRITYHTAQFLLAWGFLRIF